MADSNQLQTPEKALATLRILWAAMVMGVVIFTVVATVAGPLQPSSGPQDALPSLLFYISLVMMATGVAMGIFLRGQIYKRGWEGLAVKPGAYFSGTLIALALIEGPALFGGVSLMLADRIFPYIISPLLGIALMLLCFPTGKPMQPRQPDLGDNNPYAHR
jgi:uncharacterized integral membrane protein